MNIEIIQQNIERSRMPGREGFPMGVARWTSIYVSKIHIDLQLYIHICIHIYLHVQPFVMLHHHQ